MSEPVQPTLLFREGTLLLSEWTGRPPRELPGAWIWDDRVRTWRTDALTYPRLAPHLAERGIADQVPAWPDVAWPQPKLHALRPEQQTAVDAWLPTRRGLLVMPTGTGKTEVALHLMRQTVCATLVVAPVRDLMYQWHQRIRAGLGYDAGILGDNTYNVRPVTVTTYDSACIHMERLGAQFRLLIFDECHHLPGPIRRDAARMSAAPWRMGLSATPERSDGRHEDLDALIGPVLYHLPLADVAGRTLAEYEVVRLPVHLTEAERFAYDECSRLIRDFRYQQVRERPDFEWGDLHALAAEDPAARAVLKAHFRKEAIEDRAAQKLRVLEDLFRLHQGQPTIVFTGSNAMARAVSLRFLIPCLLHHCGKKERQEILDGFRTGAYPALVANEVLDEGVDLPEAKVAVVLGGQSNTKQARQRLGRVLRRHGERTAILYDVVCTDTREEMTSRRRRRNDAFARTRHSAGV